MGKTSKKQSNGAMPPKTSASTPAVKDGRATKPAAAKAKNETVQKVAAANLREEGHKSKKTKKTKKAPSPESESDSDESDGSDSDVDMDSSSNSGSASSASSSGSESESEDEKVAPTKSANGVKAKASKNVEQDTSSSSESSEDSENEDSDNGKQSAEANKPKSNGNSKGVKKTTKPEDDSEDDTSGEDKVASTSAAAPGKVADPQGNSDSDSDSDGDSEDDSDADDAKLTVKANGTTADEKNTGGNEKDDDGSDESASDDDDGSDESSDEEAPPASKKRKAENVASSEAKKARVETKDIPVDATNNLFVGQLSWNVDEEWLKREFEGFGTVTNAQVKTDRESGRSRGFGFVEFAEIADAVKAKQEMHGAEIDGRAIKTDYSPTRTPNPPKFNTRERAQQYGDRESSPSDTLFVGNLSFDADDSMVREVFEQYGTVTRVALPTDQATGNLKGYGYISYTTMDEAKEAKAQLTGGEIAGRSIRLDFAGPRPTNNGNSGGRGNFGGRGGRGRGGFGDRGGRGGRGGGRGGSTNRGGFSDFKGKKTSF